MATVTNKALNTGTITNKEFGSSDLTVEEATFLVSEASGDLQNPYGISNKALHTATVTNKAISG